MASTVSKKTADPRSKARTQIIRSGGGIFGSLLGGLIAAVLGRRLSYFLISLVALFASTYIFTQLDPLHPAFQVWTFILGFISIIYFGWLPLFLPELFPTRVRSTGSGVSFNTGRVVAGVVVLSAGLLARPVGRRVSASRLRHRADLRGRYDHHLVRPASRRLAGGLTVADVGLIGVGLVGSALAERFIRGGLCGHRLRPAPRGGRH